MRPRLSLLALACMLPLLLLGCGGEDVIVQVSVEDADGQAQLVEDQPVTFLPYNRDSIFSALAETADEPEPQVPQDLQDTFSEVSDLREQWRTAEQEWAVVRDSLQELSDSLDQLDTRSREYFALFQEFEELEAREQALDRQKDQAFQRFDSLQRAANERVDSIQSVILAWEDEAFRGYVDIVDSILQAREAEVREDTTNAQGIVRASLPGGAWWVYTRYEMPFEELYWNVRVDTLEGDTLRLDRGNADVRLKM